MNTEMQIKARNDFKKDLYKLMNDSVFSKMMENLRKRVDVKLVRSTEEDKLCSLLSTPSYAGHQSMQTECNYSTQTLIHCQSTWKCKISTRTWAGMLISTTQVTIQKITPVTLMVNKRSWQDEGRVCCCRLCRGLRSKMYSIMRPDEVEHCKAKGVKKTSYNRGSVVSSTRRCYLSKRRSGTGWRCCIAKATLSTACISTR